MAGPDPLPLPLALWKRFRAEGLHFSFRVEATEPDLWRFRFAPRTELHVHTQGEWVWKGPASRAKRLILPIVHETAAQLAPAEAEASLEERVEALRLSIADAGGAPYPPARRGRPISRRQLGA